MGDQDCQDQGLMMKECEDDFIYKVSHTQPNVTTFLTEKDFIDFVKTFRKRGSRFTVSRLQTIKSKKRVAVAEADDLNPYGMRKEIFVMLISKITQGVDFEYPCDRKYLTFYNTFFNKASSERIRNEEDINPDFVSSMKYQMLRHKADFGIVWNPDDLTLRATKMYKNMVITFKRDSIVGKTFESNELINKK
jgi:hypothetical protein